MKFFKYLLFTLLLINSVHADELRMKNGRVYKNIRIESVEYSTIIIYYNNERQFIPIMDAESWTRKIPYDETRPGEIYENDIMIAQGGAEINPCKNTRLLELEQKENATEQELREFMELNTLCDKYKSTPVKMLKYKNIIVLPLGITFLAGGYHYISSGLDYTSKDPLFSGNNRRYAEKVVFGAVLAAGGLFFTIMALKPVVVTVKPDRLSVRVNF